MRYLDALGKRLGRFLWRKAANNHRWERTAKQFAAAWPWSWRPSRGPRLCRVSAKVNGKWVQQGMVWQNDPARWREWAVLARIVWQDICRSARP